MSTKPVDNGRFGATAGGVDAVNISIPSSGQRDTGWTPGQSPPSGVATYLENIAYKWRKWLDDGDVSFNTLAVTGATTLTGLLNANGGVAVPTAKAVALAGTTTFTVGTGATTLGGTLDVTGVTTLTGLFNANGGINVPTAKAVALVGTTTLTTGTGAVSFGGTLNTTGLITSAAGFTAAAGQHATLSAGGLYKHGQRIQAAVFLRTSDLILVSGGALTGPTSGNFGVTLAASSVVRVPLPLLPTHNMITSIYLAFDNAVDASNVSGITIVQTTDAGHASGSPVPGTFSVTAAGTLSYTPAQGGWIGTGKTLQATGARMFALEVVMSAAGAAKVTAITVGYTTP